MDLGEVITRLNATLDIEDEDLITDVVVIAKILDPNGRVSMGLAASEGTDWLTKLALLTAGKSAFDDGYFEEGAVVDNDEDES